MPESLCTICFGNLSCRPRGERTYAWMLPDLLEARGQELGLGVANREMKEMELYREITRAKKVGTGIVDIKSFSQETPQDVDGRIREVSTTSPRRSSPPTLTVAFSNLSLTFSDKAEGHGLGHPPSASGTEWHIKLALLPPDLTAPDLH